MEKFLSLFLLSSFMLAACQTSEVPVVQVDAQIQALAERNITLGSFVFFAPSDWSEIETSNEGDQLLLMAKVPDSQYDVVLNVRIKPSTNSNYFYDTILKEQESPDFVTDGGQKIYVSGCDAAMCLAFEYKGLVYDLDSWLTSSQEVPADQDGPFLYDTDIDGADIKVFLKTMGTK